MGDLLKFLVIFLLVMTATQQIDVSLKIDRHPDGKRIACLSSKEGDCGK